MKNNKFSILLTGNKIPDYLDTFSPKDGLREDYNDFEWALENYFYENNQIVKVGINNHELETTLYTEVTSRFYYFLDMVNELKLGKELRLSSLDVSEMDCEIRFTRISKEEVECDYWMNIVPEHTLLKDKVIFKVDYIIQVLEDFINGLLDDAISKEYITESHKKEYWEPSDWVLNQPDMEFK